VSDDRRNEQNGPTPVRASMGAGAPEQEPKATAQPGFVKRFRHGGQEWLARIAGESAYGTGQEGMAYLVAVHFFHASDDATPLKEALLPAARFPGLVEPELEALLEQAVAIDLDREPSPTSRTGRRPLGRRSGGGSSSGRSR
jgi:hypothetical protein